jgi:hypothetical protein
LKIFKTLCLDVKIDSQVKEKITETDEPLKSAGWPAEKAEESLIEHNVKGIGILKGKE